MDIKYNVTKLRENKAEEVKDHVSVEEPLEMNLRFKQNSNWHTENLSITMRTPGNDEDLVTGFLFNERIIEDVNQIIKIEKLGDKVGDYNIQNKIEATIDNIKNIDIGKLLMSEQSEFSKTGGIHASSLIDDSGKVIVTREDVGRHNALDKLIGYVHRKKFIDNRSQFIACSGRLNFELIQKGLMSNIGVMAGVGAPTSLAIDLAKRFEMTLMGFVKNNSFNIYTNKERIII